MIGIRCKKCDAKSELRDHSPVIAVSFDNGYPARKYKGRRWEVRVNCSKCGNVWYSRTRYAKKTFFGR